MWMMPLHQHVNQKSDYDDDGVLISLLSKSSCCPNLVLSKSSFCPNLDAVQMLLLSKSMKLSKSICFHNLAQNLYVLKSSCFPDQAKIILKDRSFRNREPTNQAVQIYQT